MSNRNIAARGCAWVTSLTLAVGLALALPAKAPAGMPPAGVVSGTVTSVGGADISVDGRDYSVRTSSPALHELSQVHPGQQVDVVLSGPPNAAGSQVIAIHVHQ